MERFVPPAFMGFAGQISGLQLRDRYRAHSATITLIARRSRQRAGTRQWRRGADLEAAVANFVESEQLVVVDGGMVQSSFVQVGAGWERWMGLGEAAAGGGAWRAGSFLRRVWVGVVLR